MRSFALAPLFWVMIGVAPAQELPALTGLIRDCGSLEAQSSICRITRLPTLADAESILAGKTIGARREDDVLTIVAKAPGEELSLINGLHASMGRVEGEIWALMVRSPLLDQASLRLMVMTDEGASSDITWRGPLAPPLPAFERELQGQLLSHRLESVALGGSRTLAVYLPPGHVRSQRYPVAYVADGNELGFTARVVEASIKGGRLPPLILIGIPSGSDEQRSRDYLVNWRGSNAHFEAHERFLLQEVMPWAEREFGASSQREGRVLVGKSSGGAWALDTAIRNPTVFGQAVPFAVGYEHAGAGVEIKGRPRLMMVTGVFDDFIFKTREIASRAKLSGDEVVLLEPVAGHGGDYYEVFFETALSWAFKGS